MHAPEFQKLEATWRGLKYLLSQTETSTMLKIKVLNVSKKELLRDLQRAPEFDQSALFKKVYEEEYGVFGGAPFGALLGDYEFGKSGQDIELLEKVSQVAAAAHAPFLTAASSEMLNLESFSSLDQSPRPGQDLREHRIRQVESVPSNGGLPLRRPDGASHAAPRALRQGHRAGRSIPL